MTTPNKLSDPDRLEAVDASGLLDSPPEPDFDRLARLAAQLLHAPGAFVTILTENRQYLKSVAETEYPTFKAGASTPMTHSFCQYAVASDAPFIVEDARVHDLVKDNRSVGNGIIAYAGIPLQTEDGQSIGALCVVDSKPRQWSSDEIGNLRSLARSAMQLMAERQAPAERSPAGSFNPDARSLIDCVAHHLRAANSYTALISSNGALDLKAEEVARTKLVESLEDLRQAFQHHGARAAHSEPELAAAVSRYLDADKLRSEAAQGFSEGSTDLPSLKAAIQRHMDTADGLRIAAMDSGAEL